MEEGDHHHHEIITPQVSGGGIPASSSSRWNPTKEQINVLENLYGQGIRTPSADQIQQITARLRQHGHVEGKNVFYWFQNQKARQRQRQKQKQAFLNCCSANSPVLSPPQSAGCCGGPYYVAEQSQLGGLYPQYRRRYDILMTQNNNNCNNNSSSSRNYYDVGNGNRHHLLETLPLFPLHPTTTGLLRETTPESSDRVEARPEDISTSTSSDDDHGGSTDQPFFDFFH